MRNLLIWLPLLLAMLGLPMALGLVEPNPIYGFRTSASLASDAVWYRANTVAGFAMVASGVAGFIISWRIAQSDLSEQAKSNLQTAVLVGIAIIALVAGLVAS